MRALVLVRHGKASVFGPTGYDRLSEPGFAQARALGGHLVAQGVRFDSAFVGPRRRHEETLGEVRAAYAAAGLHFPEAAALPELDEHDGMSLLFNLAPRLASTDPDAAAVCDALARGEPPPRASVLPAFKRVTRQWARGELSHPDVESFAAFRARVRRGLVAMAAQVGGGAACVAFTSAGTVAAAVGAALDVPSDEAVLELSWSLYNGSVTELTSHGDRFRLRTFNETGHLSRGLVTSV